MARPIRIANCSGFYGDRLSAAREMVEGGPIDVLTGDWLAELTMLILAKNRMKDPATGYAKTFIRQMEEVMSPCLDKGIRVVANAGGLAPSQCAEAIRVLASSLGLSPRVAVVEGDDLLPRLEELAHRGLNLAHWETGESLGQREILTANAYLGCWGIAEALKQGADIVVTGRVTDAAVVMGPAAWHHNWKRDDYDALAGALVAGHVIECGTQATGGNYAFFHEVADLKHPGFPIAEISEDGSSVITKHEDHSGLVSVGTVTAQLLYEIDGPEYLNPDASAQFDTIELAQEGKDRVRISNVHGQAPPETLKVCINCAGGYRTTMTLILTGLNIEEKADVYTEALWASFPEGRDTFEDVTVDLIRTDHEDPQSNGAAIALLRITVKDPDPEKVGRMITQKAVELGLANYPGLTGLPSQTQAYGVYWPASISSELVPQTVLIEDDRWDVSSVAPDARSAGKFKSPEWSGADAPGGRTVRAPLGRIAGARSGDKGGNANIGLWTRTDAEYAWLKDYLTIERFGELIPEAQSLKVDRYLLPNIRAINFVIRGLLGEGVASSTRIDPQAKGLGEYVRAKHVDIPESLLEEAG